MEFLIKVGDLGYFDDEIFFGGGKLEDRVVSREDAIAYSIEDVGAMVSAALAFESPEKLIFTLERV